MPLLGTSSGLNWLLAQAKVAIPGELQVGAIEGGLFGHLRLRDVQYRDAAMAAGADELLLHWSPSELLQRRFHLFELSVKQPRFTRLAPAPAKDESEEDAGGPIELPNLQLPIEIQLDKVTIEDFEFRAEADAEPVMVERLSLAASWNIDGILLDHLALRMPEVAFDAQGKLNPSGDYPLELSTAVAVALAEIPKVEAKGRIHGDLKEISLQQSVTGDVQVELDASVTDPLGELGWRAAIDLHSLLLHTLAPEVEGNVSGKLNASGDLVRVKADGTIALDEAAAFHGPWRSELALNADIAELAVVIEKLILTRPESPLRLSLSGNADAKLNLDIEGQWQALQWPPTGDAQFGSESGSLQLKGSAEAYRLRLQALVAGSDIPDGEWRIEGAGNQESFRIEQLKGETLEGTLGLSGAVTWAPAISWDASVETAGINPGAHYPDWPGKLDLKLTSQGGIENDVLQVATVIETLQGQLRERPLAASGSVKVVGEEIDIEAFQFSSGAARVEAEGNLGQASDLAWKIDISDLGDLLPEAAGRIDGEGSVAGPMTEPSVNGRLAARTLAFQNIKVESLDAEISADISDKSASRLDLRGRNIQAGAESIANLSIKAAGRKSDHRLDARLEHAMAKVELAMAGAYEEAATVWSGALNTLAIRSADFGDWNLKGPTPISAGAEVVKLSGLCLMRETGSICATADLKEMQGKAQLKANGLLLNWLADYLPPQIERLDGAIGLTVDATLSDKPLAKAELTLSPGAIVVLPPDAPAITLEHQGGGLEGSYGARQVAAKLRFDMGEDGLSGQIAMPRAALDKDPMTAPIDAKVELRFRQLEHFASLAPMIENLDGEVLADLALGGSMAKPAVRGALRVDMPRLGVPDAGLELRDIALKARSDDGKHLTLDGGLASGKGRIGIDGEVTLDPDNNWPLQVNLKGNDFSVLNLPKMNAYINTDMAFSSSPEGMRLDGTLNIPHAYIELDHLPSGAASPSADVVVVSDEDEAAPPKRGAPFAMAVTVALGDDVQFRGFGLKAYFEGRLGVNQIPGEFPTGSGELHVKEGTYRAYGQDLVIDRGIVSYSGGRIDNPALNVRAARETDVDFGNGPVQVNAGVDVTGSAKKPKISVFSQPAMEERDAISIMLTGNTMKNIGKGGGSLDLGAHQVSKDLSVGARYDPSTSKTEIVTKYRFNRKFHVEATTSSESNAADLFYSIEFD